MPSSVSVSSLGFNVRIIKLECKRLNRKENVAKRDSKHANMYINKIPTHTLTQSIRNKDKKV